ncbi:hypothetical protein [Moorena sp. SIO1F2]|nr:hypothetical protein [Moorena sp. SIO1F2]
MICSLAFGPRYANGAATRTDSLVPWLKATKPNIFSVFCYLD